MVFYHNRKVTIIYSGLDCFLGRGFMLIQAALPIITISALRHLRQRGASGSNSSSDHQGTQSLCH